MELGNVSQPAYGPGPEPPGSSTPGLVGMVHGFLRLVQPNALPAELIAELGREESSREQVQELLRYELGFLVCAAIGLLFIILVPLVGCCFCCCRCCGNCGGRMYQKQGRRSGCRRRALYASVLLVSAVLLAGDVCAFISNSRLSQAVSGTFPNVNATAGDLRAYLASIPEQINFIAASSDVPLGRANASLQSIGPTLGGVIISGIRRSVNEAVGSLQSLLGVMGTLAAAFGGINSTSRRLEELQSDYSQWLAGLRATINRTLQDCGQPCGDVSLGSLEFKANFSAIPSVEQQLKALEDVSGSNLVANLEKVNRTLNETPDKVHEQSRDVVTKTQGQLGQIRQAISNMPERLPVKNLESSGVAFLDNATSTLEEYREPVTAFEKLRWSVCALLCCMVLLVVICNVFGLVLGPLGLEAAALPTERGCLSNAGGNFFMAGVGFSFLFSWLLMLVVLVPFVLGGNIYMLFCQSLQNQQLFQLLDTPGLIPGFNLSQVLGEGSTNISELYRQCRDDAALWQTLHLDQWVSLDELLNISQYTAEISTAFEKVNITLSPISLLNQSHKDLLLKASRLGQPPDFARSLAQLDQNVTRGSLQDLAAELELLAEKAGAGAKQDLEDGARKLRELDREMNVSFSRLLQNLKEDIYLVERRAGGLQAQTNATLQKVEQTQASLGRETASIIRNETRAFLQQLLGFFETYVAWAKSSLTREVARCKPVARTLDSVEAMACDYILDSVNAFWFSLGWCTFLLLPSIILAVRLAKFYRRMDSTDVYETEVLEIR
ncbi:prominin-1-A-like isoform X1 [Apteryx mantelli]|uniref:Prominin-1-A-like isoform X1 n=1 Tax=Apteryx mantelli TaxID=2696672 RepID=A0ABM4EU65_9AVES